MNLAILFVNEHSSEKYPPRTAYNAKSADLTLALAVDLTTAGEKLTHKMAGDKYLGIHLNENTMSIDVARQLYKKLVDLNGKKLNIAGNGIYTLSKTNCDQSIINQFTYEVIAQVHHFYPIEKIYTGGQTGVDLSGAVAGYFLGIPTEVTLPKGFLQRFDKEDIVQTKEDIIHQITSGALALTPYTPVGKKTNKPHI